jgi:hypothetical protein
VSLFLWFARRWKTTVLIVIIQDNLASVLEYEVVLFVSKYWIFGSHLEWTG